MSYPKTANSKPCPPAKRRVNTHNSPLVLVVGVCSAGKTTLVRNLRDKGYRARSCAQEHSYVPHLWRLSSPDVLIYLDASLHTIRRRRSVRWRHDILDEEHRRLADAREHCDLYIYTDGFSPQDVASRALTYLNNHWREKNGSQ